MNTKKLKQLVLDLAIHGKLVPQDPNDEPASELLKRIQADVETHGRASNKSKGKKSAVSSVDLDEVPFEVPEGWCWCTLNDLALYKKGPFGSSLTKSMFVEEATSTYKVYEQKNAIQKDASLGSYYITKEKFEELKGFEIFPGDIIVSCAGTIGETYVLPSEIKKGIINQALMIVRLYSKDIQDYYLVYFDYMLKHQASSDSKGTAIKNIPPFDILKGYFIPLPPLAEQHRIVAEIEKWFAVIDQLEKNEADLKKSIEQTKKKVLDLAIRGKLVAQNPEDEPAGELLARIRADVETHGRASKSKKSSIPSVDLDEVPFEVPEGWEWCRLGDVADQVGSKDNQILAKEVKEEGLIPVVSQSSILIDGYSDEIDRKMTDLPVILFGDHTRVVKYIDFECVIGADGTKLLKALIVSKYLYYWTICAADSIRNRGYARHFALLKEVPFPLPPLAEQKRIVEKIEEVFGVLERIEGMM